MISARSTFNPATRLVGHSGFSVTLEPDGTVLKAGSDSAGDRLERQCVKQESFAVASRRFSVCPILEKRRRGRSFEFRMPFCGGETAIEFIDRASPEVVRDFAVAVCELVGEFIAASESGPLPREAVLRKSESVRDRLVSAGCAGEDLMAAVEAHLDDIRNLPGDTFLMGACHGDLTFGNMAFRNRGRDIVLFDFLDSYIEAPIVDFAKLLQETRLHWSSITSPRRHDAPKYRIAMRAVESELLARLGHLFPPAQVQVFEFQNILRVLPNAADDAVRAALEARARVIIEDPK